MTLFVVSATVLLFGAAFAVLFVRLISRVDASACTSEWLENFSLESYAPMQRLLDKQDFVFLAAQRGYRPEIAKRLLAERRKVFLSYLRNLVRDFNQLLALARLMIVYSGEDRREFAGALWRQQVNFYFVVTLIRCRVALFPLGLSAGQIRDLLETLGGLRAQIQRLTDVRVEAVRLA